MGGLILALLLRAAPYLTHLFWPILACAVLAGCGIQVALDTANGALDREYALAFLAVIALGVAACITWAVGNVREYRRAQPPQPNL
ncbi:hypothetical protein [Glycomyces sp. NPDC048151]|uniref:hypothetical protein n=1 Tax=Glycomyces sp. NPDC048151 TaxID=3364002 RepID=UPI0037236F26